MVRSPDQEISMEEHLEVLGWYGGKEDGKEGEREVCRMRQQIVWPGMSSVPGAICPVGRGSLTFLTGGVTGKWRVLGKEADRALEA